MRTARTTFLMTAAEKAALEQRAAKRGVSSGEYIRLAVDNYERLSEEDEAALSALAAEVNAAIPKMNASLDHSINTLKALHEEMDAFLREKGVRE